MYNEVSLGGTMKKGFTLIELLIVMVVLGILVTIAMPKYRASLERGRAMEGINNLRAASDAVNARYIMDGNIYNNPDISFAALTKSKNFSKPGLTGYSPGFVFITVTREGGEYSLSAYNTDGELKYITCTGDTELCQAIGAELVGSSYMFDFRN